MIVASMRVMVVAPSKMLTSDNQLILLLFARFSQQRHMTEWQRTKKKTTVVSQVSLCHRTRDERPLSVLMRWISFSCIQIGQDVEYPQWSPLQYKKRLLPRCIHYFKSEKSDLINNVDHMRISGTKPSSVILSQTK